MRSGEREPFIFQTFEPRLLLTVGIYPSSDGHLEVYVDQLPPAADYQIYRGDGLGQWTPVADLGALDPYIGGGFIDTTASVASGNVYRYAVYDGNGNQLDSTTLVTGIQLSGSAIGNTAHLSWNTDPSFNFQLFGGTAGYTGLYLGNASSYTDTGLAYNSWYSYSLAENTYNQWSSFEVWTPPGAMDGITAQLVPGGNEIDIAAQDNGTSSGWGTDSFGVMNVYRGTTPDFTLDADHRIATGVTSFADTTVSVGTTYYYEATNLAPYTGLESLPVSASATTPGGEPIVSAQSIHATAGTAYSGPVATFSQSGTDIQPTDYSATINWGDGTPTGTTTGASPDLVITINPNDTYSVTGTHTYAIGSQTSASALVTVTRSASGVQGSATDPTTITQVQPAILNLTAQTISSGSIRLNWTPGNTTATGYRIESSTDGDVSFHAVDTLGASANSYTLNGASTDGTPVTIRIVPFNGAGDGEIAVTGALSPGQSTGFYKVYFNEGGAPSSTNFIPVGSFVTDIAGTPITSLAFTSVTQSNGGWVSANSPTSAILQAFSGSVTVYGDGHDTTGSGSRADYVYGTSNLFHAVDDLCISGQDLGAAVVFHNPRDADSNQVDAYVPVAALGDIVATQAIANQTADANGNVQVGMFSDADGNSLNTEFTANVTWSDGSTSAGTINQTANGMDFSVYATPPQGVDPNIITVIVTHTITGVTGTGAAGSTPPPGGPPKFTKSVLMPPAKITALNPTPTPYVHLQWVPAGNYVISRQLFNRSTLAQTALVSQQFQVFTTGANDTAIIPQGIDYSTTINGVYYDSMRYYINNGSIRSAPAIVTLESMKAFDAGIKVTSPVPQILQTTASVNPGAAGETISWYWDQPTHYAASAQFRVYRTDLLNPAAGREKVTDFVSYTETTIPGSNPVTPQIFGINSFKYTLNDTTSGNYANSMYQYDIQAYMVNAGDTGFQWSNVAISEVKVMAPQVFMIMGGNNPNATSYSDVMRAAGFQVHGYVWNPVNSSNIGVPGNTTFQDTVDNQYHPSMGRDLINDIAVAQAANVSIVLAGVSFGGGEAVRLVNGEQAPDPGRNNVLKTYKITPNYLALFDPVAPLNDSTLPYDAGKGNHGNGVQANHMPDFNIPGTNWPVPVTDSTLNPNTQFTLPGTMKNYDNWWIPYRLNYYRDSNQNTFFQRDDKGVPFGFATGSVSGPTPTDPAAGNHTTLTYAAHTSQLDSSVFFQNTNANGAVFPANISNKFSTSVKSLTWTS